MTRENTPQLSMRLKGKSAVITGGASGMGRSTVLRFLAEGANIVVADFNQATGATLMHEAEALGFAGHIVFIATDVAVENDVAAPLAKHASYLNCLCRPAHDRRGLAGSHCGYICSHGYVRLAACL